MIPFMKLEGRTAFITGASKRIGREIAMTLAKGGADILLHYHRSKEEAVRLKTKMEALGVRVFLLAADFSKRKEPFQRMIRHVVAEVYRKARRVDILVNNAAIFYPTPFGNITEKDWDDFLAVNLKVPFFLSQEIGKRMVKQKSGKIINLVDWSAFRPSTHYLPYAVSKAALIAATAGLAKALAPYVQVNSIAPGPILPFKGMTKKEKEAVLRKTLLKRFGDPRDIAETVRFLIEGTDFITGAFIPVDGGSLVA
jgi:NAD(P)-dependent dehydrogenase (short-subunit alcohol dehydrogenase family)